MNMNRIDHAFKTCRDEGRKALVIFVSAGDPNLECTEEIVVAAAEAGADIIELGVPFSDPVGDKVAFLKEMNAQLAVATVSANVTMEDLFETLKIAAPVSVATPSQSVVGRGS